MDIQPFVTRFHQSTGRLLRAAWVFYRAKGQPWWRKGLSWCALCLTSLVVYIVLVEMNFLWLFGYSPSIMEINNPRQNVASEVYATDGRLLGKFFYENRTPVSFGELSPTLVKTLIATEDARFYYHHGIDFKAMGAVVADALRGTPRGGSTLTQQLVKNLFKTRQSNHGLLGAIPVLKIFIIKSKEWINAVKIEMFFTKEEILTSYLNTVDFGNNSFGIKTAAKTYFNTTPARLKPEQCAVLVGMLKAPTAYNPRSNHANSLQRRNLVISIMKRDSIITPAQHDSLVNLPLLLDFNVETEYDGTANYFRQAVHDYLKPWLRENDLDIFADGLKIHTTLDYTMQGYAEDAVTRNMRRVQRQFDGHWQGQNPWVDANNVEIPGFLQNVVRYSWEYKRLKDKYNNNKDSITFYLSRRQKRKLFSWNGTIDTVCSFYEATNYLKRILHAGYVVLDPHTGAIRAYVGGIDFKHFKYDNVQSMRQPGSTFKAFVYATAMSRGYSPCDSLPDTNIVVRYKEKGVEKIWTPHNSDWSNVGGNVALKYAFAHSLNTISVQLTQKLGVESVISMAHKLGIEADLDTVPSVCLGSSDVTLLELVAAYCPLINGGYRVTPMFVTRVEDREGNVLKEFTPQTKKVLDNETVFLMQQLFLGSLSEPYGTTQALFSHDMFRFNTDFGGKTGTSSNHSDGWFVGVSPNLVGGAWVGAEERCVHFRISALGEGCKTALPIFGMFMAKVLKDTAYKKLRGKFPQTMKGLTRSYSCHTKYVPRDTIDSLGVPPDSLLSDGVIDTDNNTLYEPENQ